jgi:hypothetical protein
MTIEQALDRLAKGKSLLQDELTPEQLVDLKSMVQFSPLQSNIGIEFELYTKLETQNTRQFVEDVVNHFQSYGLSFDIDDGGNECVCECTCDEEHTCQYCDYGCDCGCNNDTYSFGNIKFKGEKSSPREGWALMPDGSITPPNSEYSGLELVSPVLTPTNYLEQLRCVSKALNEVDNLNQFKMQFNSTCGMHIHIDIPNRADYDLYKENILRIYKLWLKIQHEVAYYILPNYRENTFYAKFNPEVANFNDPNVLRKLKSSRYYMMAIRENTFEFRLFPMTRNLHTMQRRILLVDRIVQYALNDDIDIPNISLFRDVLRGHIWLQNYLLATRKKLLSSTVSSQYNRHDEAVIPIY